MKNRILENLFEGGLPKEFLRYCKSCDKFKSPAEFGKVGGTAYNQKRPECLLCAKRNGKVTTRLKKAFAHLKPRDNDYKFRCPDCLRNRRELELFCRHKALWVIDHDHKTEKFRAWICQLCNVGSGYFNDDPETLRRRANNLELYASKDYDADLWNLFKELKPPYEEVLSKIKSFHQPTDVYKIMDDNNWLWEDFYDETERRQNG